MDKKILIKNLAKRINFSKININLIKKNSKKIFILYKKIKQIWDTLEINIDLIELEFIKSVFAVLVNAVKTPLNLSLRNFLIG
jgi:DNA-binding Xre family transcriptional regulator